MGTLLVLIAWALLAGLPLHDLWGRPIASWAIGDLAEAFLFFATTFWAVDFGLRHRREDAASQATTARTHDEASPRRS